ncbi:MAG TPA: redox-regulated ATPase YchF [Candidatus Methanoculleus thermohydrogenotrophicum]|jgi:ribosome-binding ATPase YchF (GTP1/OBG family)|nr:redox-regulated ATPase YchF [Candidatus Methanoculleus thermohydrogenotrophicum]NLM83015.1 redox-regulated ATPase YchF [Candidatus Methanoculleus thermohydrogenotrophicum]HOB17606.1 redox-regulated ATPase YchF [Candidatus Methanoculleus thermohydrogenotrophicum]HPZ38283.1 redox-regulated ATPase YchF [Candidatus Methanoculleus thermohydrogenotrophicum]
MITLAIAGKPNCGKSTFFRAATLAPAEIANYPFTTIDANHGVAYVRTTCPCREMDVPCENCQDGVRFVPIGLIDVAGLVPEAHKGRGLGNQFLDNLRQADAILQIVDASGATDAEGNPVDIGSRDPVKDIEFLQYEMSMWMYGILSRHWAKLKRQAQARDFSLAAAIADVFAGLGVTFEHVRDASEAAGVDLRTAGEEDLIRFCRELMLRGRPMLIVGNKADQAPKECLDRLAKHDVIFASAAGELVLRIATEGKFITYRPGDRAFEINPEANLTAAQRAGLQKVAEFMQAFNGTGVQQALDAAVFDLLDMVVVFPVEDENKLTDGRGRVLPDAFLMKRGSTPRDLAYQVHTEIGEGFLYAIDAKTGMRVKDSLELKSGDIIKIVSVRK